MFKKIFNRKYWKAKEVINENIRDVQECLKWCEDYISSYQGDIEDRYYKNIVHSRDVYRDRLNLLTEILWHFEIIEK